MLNSMKKSFLAIVPLTLLACGGLSDDEIADALRNSEQTESFLNFKVGQTWAGTRVVTTIAADPSFGGSDDAPYKFEGGVAQPCEQAAALAAATGCGVPRTVKTIATTAVTAEVVGKSDTAISRTAGWVVREGREVETNAQWFWPAAGTASADMPKSKVKSSVLYTFSERNNFVTVQGENAEADSTFGSTQYPSHPQGGRTYTDDNGMSWTVIGRTAVDVGGRNLAAAQVTVATNQIDHTLLEIRDKCFVKEPNVGGTSFDVVRQAECSFGQMPFTIEYEQTAEIGNDLVLRQRIRSVDITITDWGVRDATGALVDNNVPNSVTGEIVFLYTQQTRETVFTMTDLQF